MELLGGLIAAGLVAAAPAVPGLRSVAKAVVKGGMAVADATVAVAVVVTHQVGDLMTHVRSADDGETVVDEETVMAAATEAFSPDAQMADGPQTTPTAEAPADLSSAAVADDLVQISGIGPKVASLLQEAGIASFAVLAATPVERLREILDGAGARYRVTDPTSWPAQAQALKDAPKTDQVKAVDVNDLVQINGIGPKIAILLQEAGITNLMELAATPVERLQEILDGAGARYRVTDPSSWPAQAQALLDTIKLE